MKKLILIVLLVCLVLSLGCIKKTADTFGTELSELREIEARNMLTNESTVPEIQALQSELLGFRERAKTEGIKLLVDYKVYMLEAQINAVHVWNNLEGFNFDCTRAESIELAEAYLGRFYGNATLAADKLEEFITEFPENAAEADINSTTLGNIRQSAEDIMISFDIVKASFEQQCSEQISGE